MSTPEDQLEEAARKATLASDIAYQWVNGPEYAYVTTDSGSVPTIAEVSRSQRNLLPDLQAESSKAVEASLSAASSATSAAASATTAKNEADKATMISGLETVTDAIGLAATPFPDVWIPLNDSLRMMAGFGDEIKVGDYTVATQARLTRNSDATLINKSGQLVNAAINKARFENEGLLVEPIKTNICRWNSVRIPSGGAAPSNVVSLAYPNITAKKVVGGAATIALGASKEIVKSLTKYSAIAVIDLKNSNIPNNKLRLQFAYSAAWGGLRYIDIDTITLSVYSPNGTTGTARLVGDLLEIAATTTSSETAESSGGGSVDLYYIGASGEPAVPPADGSVCIVMFQLEEGDPTSVIVTANSAVTRAADKLTIPRLNNECVEWYSGADSITPIVTADTIELVPPAGKRHLRNMKGFFTPLTAEQKALLK